MSSTINPTAKQGLLGSLEIPNTPETTTRLIKKLDHAEKVLDNNSGIMERILHNLNESIKKHSLRRGNGT